MKNLFQVAFRVEYDGSRYYGFQIQPRAITVQGQIEKAVLSLVGRDFRFRGACRTDTGVHGLDQVFAVQSDKNIPPSRFAHAMNRRLEAWIRVTHAWNVPLDFHPRFEALERRYRFVLKPRTGKPHVHESGYVTQVPENVDWLRVRAAAEKLIGFHNYVSFTTVPSEEEKTNRSIDQILVRSCGPYILLDFHAQSFLRGMVRNITGWLVAIGSGRYEPAIIDELLARQTKDLAVKPALPHGLYLIRVVLPGDEPPAIEPLTLPVLGFGPGFVPGFVLSPDSGSPRVPAVSGFAESPESAEFTPQEIET